MKCYGSKWAKQTKITSKRSSEAVQAETSQNQIYHEKPKEDTTKQKQAKQTKMKQWTQFIIKTKRKAL